MQDFTLLQLFSVLVLWGSVQFALMLLSRFEKRFRKRNNPIQTEYQQWSLPIFKLMLQVLSVFIALEAALSSHFSIDYVLIGSSLLLIGLLLRILAIISLGRMWTYRVAILEHHTVVNTGIYKYLRHPAYIGNVYLVGLALVFCAPVSSIISMCFVIIFITLRVPREHRIILQIDRGLQ